MPGSFSILVFCRFRRYLLFMAMPATATGKRPPASPRLPQALTEESSSIMKLDAKTVAALKLEGKQDAIFFDDAMPGFGYRLRLSGGKVRRSWVAQYKRAGATRRITLGSAEVLGAEAARVAAKKVLAKVALGAEDWEGGGEGR